MAFKLLTPYGDVEPLKLIKLAALKQLATTSPFSVAQAKTDIEAGQDEAFSSSAWYSYLNSLYVMQAQIDITQLTTAEKDIFNQLREFLAPAPFQGNCADNDPEAGGIILSATHKAGSTYEYELKTTFTALYKCTIVTIEATKMEGELTPSSIPVMGIIGAIGGNNTYSGLWLTFGDEPSGTYSFDLVFKDIAGAVIGSTINKSITF